MQKSRKTPYVFLVVLLIIIVFIIGMKYGQRVDTTNEAIAYIMSITPTKSPSPIPTQILKYPTYAIKGCGVNFVYPNTLKVNKESSQEATFAATKDSQLLYVTCNTTNTVATQLKDPKIATEEIQLKTQTIQARAKKERGNDTLLFTLRNTVNGKQIYVSIEKNLYPLFANTLQFVQ